MAKKAAIFRYLNARKIKHVLLSAISSVPWIRAYLHYYRDAICFEDIAEPGSVRVQVIDPVNDYGVKFSDSEVNNLMRSKDVSANALKLVYKMARLRDVVVLGSSGVTFHPESESVLNFAKAPGKMPLNWVAAKPLKEIPSDDSYTYINLLWVRKGHRHFAHFFWDMLIPVLAFLKHWREPNEKLIFLVREDQTSIQRETYRFLERDFPNISFQILSSNQKITCRHSIYVSCQHEFYGIANTLSQEYLTEMAQFYMRHYGIAELPSAAGTRLYVSREGAAVRRLTNESAVVQMLSKYGFKAIEPASLPFQQQAELFRAADVVVAPCGAALASLMFCRPGTRVLELFPSDYADDCFLRMSKVLEFDYRYIFGGRRNFVNRNYEIDLQKLESAVQDML